MSPAFAISALTLKLCEPSSLIVKFWVSTGSSSTTLTLNVELTLSPSASVAIKLNGISSSLILISLLSIWSIELRSVNV